MIVNLGVGCVGWGVMGRSSSQSISIYVHAWESCKGVHKHEWAVGGGSRGFSRISPSSFYCRSLSMQMSTAKAINTT